MLARRRCRLTLATGAAAAVMFAAGVPLAAEAAAAPADSVRDSSMQVLQVLDVPKAWFISQGKGVTVAVIDSGVDGNVSDLTGVVTRGPDLTGLSTPQSNPDWGEHGTWMASIIAGHGHDGSDGIIGVAPEAKIYSIRVIPDKEDPGYHTYEAEKEEVIQRSLATGIMNAVNDGVRVISMSIGYSSASSLVRKAVQYAYSHGAVLVASSGNSGQDDERRDHGYAPVSFPADYPGVLSVGALDGSGAASFSSNNLSVQVAAPGVRVPAQGRDGQYWTVDGTSPACALVAGVAALIESKYRGISPAEVIEALTSTAKNPSGGYNARTGFGTVNAVLALDKAGELYKAHPAGSQVAASERFGGGPAAVPPAPVSPRGISQLVMFVILAIMSLALAVAGGVWLAVLGRPGKGAHAAPHSGPSGSRHAADGGGYPGAYQGGGGYPGGGYSGGSGYPGGGGYSGGSGYSGGGAVG
jgi:type VII secretion-associated serine protease mycosin